jgi:hypothetical protein
MKTFIALLLLVSSTGLGELSKKEVSSLKKRFSIDRVSVHTERKHKKKFETVAIKCSTEWREHGDNYYYSPKVSVKVVVEFTDEDKNTYLVKKIQKHHYIPRNRSNPPLKLIVPYGEYKRLEVTGYAVQHGIYKDGNFIPYEEELFKTKTLEELKGRTTNNYTNGGIRVFDPYAPNTNTVIGFNTHIDGPILHIPDCFNMDIPCEVGQ